MQFHEDKLLSNPRETTAPILVTMDVRVVHRIRLTYVAPLSPIVGLLDQRKLNDFTRSARSAAAPASAAGWSNVIPVLDMEATLDQASDKTRSAKTLVNKGDLVVDKGRL